MKAFNAQFGASVNVEWHTSPHGYEALFYIHEQEKLALYTVEGELLEKKSNLLPNEATAQIREESGRIGELMNLIKIEQANKVRYEVIVRNELLERFYMLLEEDGKVLEERKL